MDAKSHIGNPLTLIAVFAGVSEAVGTGVMPLVEPAVQSTLVWFVMLFPAVLVLLFFGTLWLAPAKLFGPSDYRTDEAYLASQGKVAFESNDSSAKLRTFLADDANRERLEIWLKEHGYRDVTPSVFVYSTVYKDVWPKVAAEMGL